MNLNYSVTEGDRLVTIGHHRPQFPLLGLASQDSYNDWSTGDLGMAWKFLFSNVQEGYKPSAKSNAGRFQ